MNFKKIYILISWIIFLKDFWLTKSGNIDAKGILGEYRCQTKIFNNEKKRMLSILRAWLVSSESSEGVLGNGLLGCFIPIHPLGTIRKTEYIKNIF